MTENITQAPQAPQAPAVKAPRKTSAPKAPQALTVAQVATLAGVSGKDMRRWLRSQARTAGAGDTLPGKGGRYSFTQAQAKALVLAYASSKAQRGTQAPGAAILKALSKAPRK